MNQPQFRIEIKKWRTVSKLLSNPACVLKYDSIYQSPEFMNFMGLGRKFSYSNHNILKNITEQNLLLYEGHELCAVVPLLIQTQGEEQNIFLRGELTSAGQLGVYYSERFSYEAFQFCMDWIRTTYSNGRILFSRIREETKLNQYIYA